MKTRKSIHELFECFSFERDKEWRTRSDRSNKIEHCTPMYVKALNTSYCSAYIDRGYVWILQQSCLNEMCVHRLDLNNVL